MIIRKKLFLIIFILIGIFIAVICEEPISDNSKSLLPQKDLKEKNLTLPLQKIKEQIEIKTINSTEILIDTMLALLEKDLYTYNILMFCCFIENQDEIIKEHIKKNGPSKLEIFNLILDELFNRGGSEVESALKTLLLSEFVNVDDKIRIRQYLFKKSKKDVSFCLTAHDKTQKRDLFLKFNPQKFKEVVIKKGDTLDVISKKVYPKISYISGVEIICFTNNLKNSELVLADQKLKIYEYEIIKDEVASWLIEE